jgi:hemoglobin/transferrin/lactoferrin receptor protein
MYGAYVQNITKLNNEKFIINAGLRANAINLYADFTNNTPTKFPYTNINQSNKGATGNFGIAYLPIENFRITTSYSTGFKAPNVDETAKVFETGTKAGYVVVPNKTLQPEYAHNIDLGFTYQNPKHFLINANFFYTALTNAIVADNYKFNGKDSILYDGKILPTIALTNNALAQIYGITANAKINILQNLVATASINYTAGKYDAAGTFASGGNNAVVPMDHIPPVFGRVGVAYNRYKFSAECWTLFNGKKDIANYNPLPASEDNIGYAIAGYGTPAWATLNFSSTYTIAKNYTIQAGVENILDTHYRHFASGISAPGRNVVIAVRTKI